MRWTLSVLRASSVSRARRLALHRRSEESAFWCAKGCFFTTLTPGNSPERDVQALDGIRVIDFTHVFAGPFCTGQLGAMGADVIKIEAVDSPDMMRPEGSHDGLAAEGRGSQFIAQSANKRSLAVSLKSDAGRAVLERIISDADVVVENFRPGVMRRAGLDADTLRDRYPRLVYCSISGFGQTGPKSRDPAYDNVVQAFSGMMAMTGGPDTGPVRVGPPVLDYGTGAQAAFAVSSALFRRERTGRGQTIDVSMLDCAMMLMSNVAVDTQIDNAPPERVGNSNPQRPAYGSFETAEGLLMIGAYTVSQTVVLYNALGFHEEAQLLVQGGREAMIATAKSGRRMLSTVMLGQTAEEWEHYLNSAGVPAARVRNLAEALHEPQVLQRGVLAPGCQPCATELRVPVTGFMCDDGGPDVRLPAPRHGEHSTEVLRSIGLSDSEVADLIGAGVVRSV